MKDIVIVANFCRDFSESDNGRFMHLCKMLAKDNSVEIITSDFRHSTKTHKSPLLVKWPFKITFLHEPGYKKNISLRRFYSHHSWGKEVKKYLHNRKKPDVIYCAVPSLSAPLYTAKYCEKNKVRFIIDIQDLWPEAFKLAFNIPVISDIVFKPFNIIADAIYKRADAIVAVSRTYANRALKVNKKCYEGNVVFLGTQLKRFDRFASENAVEKPDGEVWIGYCGTLGASYDITIVMEALAILNKEGMHDIVFIVLGDGEKRREFENKARELDVVALFKGRLPYDEMCGWISACDIAVNPIMHNAAQSIINKHGDYASAGLPVINTQESEEYRMLVEEYNMGFNCSNNDPEDIAMRIRALIESVQLRKKMGDNARRCAEERFDRDNTYNEIANLIIDF